MKTYDVYFRQKKNLSNFTISHNFINPTVNVRVDAKNQKEAKEKAKSKINARFYTLDAIIEL